MITVELDDHLFREVEQWAAQSRRPVQAVIEDAIRAALPPRRPTSEGRIVLPTFRGSGLQPGVDLENRSAILDLMDEKE